MTVATSVALAPLGRALTTDPSDAPTFGPGLVAFTIVMLLAVATALLMWSMVRQIRKVPPDLSTPTGRRTAREDVDELPVVADDPSVGPADETRSGD
ncbi:MAG: hypothetical protein WAN48_01105 [Actinomycetes bacterium]